MAEWNARFRPQEVNGEKKPACGIGPAPVK